jgi:hypothetical protein
MSNTAAPATISIGLFPRDRDGKKSDVVLAAENFPRTSSDMDECWARSGVFADVDENGVSSTAGTGALEND